VSISVHIAAQRTDHGVPHTVACRALGVPASTFYRQRNRPQSAARRRRAAVGVLVKACFEASGGAYGSPRVHAQLRRDGHRVSRETVEASMAN